MNCRFAAVAAVLAAILAGSSPAQGAGVFSVLPLTGDGDSGISAGSAFTHALDLNFTGNRTVNDAVFTGTGNGIAAPSTNNYVVGGSDGLFGPGGFGSTVSGGIGGTMTQFVYNGQPQTFTLNNLRVGEQYETTFYNTAFGETGRFVSIAASDGGLLASYEQNQNWPAGSMVKYTFTATTNSLNFTITPADSGASYHFYSATNELANYTALLTDNFHSGGVQVNDVNHNLEARQGGTLAAGAGVVTYSRIGNPDDTQLGNGTGSIDNGNYLLTAFGGRVSPDINFNSINSDGGLLISFDMAPNIVNADPGHWAGISFGASLANRFVFFNENLEHFGILFRGDGRMAVHDGGTLLVPDSIDWTAAAPVTTELHKIELLATDATDGNPFDGVGETTIEIYADGILLYTYTKGGGGYADNYLNFQTSNISATDNLLVARLNPVPEPSSLALAVLGLVAVGACVWRRRRR